MADDTYEYAAPTLRSLRELVKEMKAIRRKLALALDQRVRVRGLHDRTDAAIEELRRTGQYTDEQLGAMRGDFPEEREVNLIFNTIRGLQSDARGQWARMQGHIDLVRNHFGSGDILVAEELNKVHWERTDVDRAIRLVEEALARATNIADGSSRPARSCANKSLGPTREELRTCRARLLESYSSKDRGRKTICALARVTESQVSKWANGHLPQTSSVTKRIEEAIVAVIRPVPSR